MGKKRDVNPSLRPPKPLQCGTEIEQGAGSAEGYPIDANAFESVLCSASPLAVFLSEFILGTERKVIPKIPTRLTHTLDRLDRVYLETKRLVARMMC